MKKYLPLIESINAICWFGFDFAWMQDWNSLAVILSILSMATGVLLFCVSWTWSSVALMNWIIMNSLWMQEYTSLATVYGVLGFLMIIISILKEGNLKDFIRLKTKSI